MSNFNKLLIECEKSIDFHTNHLNYLRQQVGLLEEAKRLIKKANPKTDFEDFDEIENLNNYNGYLTISTLDLAVNLKHLILAKTDWEKVFFIKNSYLIIHETLNRLKPSKNDFLIEKSITKDYPSLSKNLKELIEDIDKFKTSSEYKKIEKTRHHTAGHITDSLKRYYDRISDLDGEIAAKNIIEFMKISRKALDLTKDYAILANDRSVEKNKKIEKSFVETLERLKKLIKK
ncbi:hypothetical protein [Salinimicrobium gaetbulicola]|uniref:HEPN AbiU2-like domain-containing protein n=1 Tax=Salinimicrobium gaetbulicola TaxID=999702 RepID=A0ABW3IBI3_9FLAO